MGDEHYLRHPSKQTFFRFLAPVMALLCLNSQCWIWYKLPTNKWFRLQRLIMPTFAPVACLSQVAFLATNYQLYDFSVLAVIMTIIPVASAVWSKVMIAQTPSYKRMSTAFMQEIHLYNFYVRKYPQHKRNFIKLMLINAEKSTRFAICMIGCIYFICYCSWMIIPITHNIQSIETIHNITIRLQLTVYLWAPYIDYEHNFYAYLVFQAIGVYLGAIAIAVIMTFDTINLALVFHLTGHIKILKYDMEKDKDEKLSDEEWTQKLIHYTTSYFFITKTFKDAQAAFGFNVFTIYAQNTIQGGLLLYQLMSSGKDTEVILTYGLMIPSFMGTLVLISVVLENVRVQTEDIPRLVYDLPWESMSISNQKMLRSIIFQVQPTLEFIAAFNMKTGVQPAINIIKTTFSYYVMIKSRKEE